MRIRQLIVTAILVAGAAFSASPAFAICEGCSSGAPYGDFSYGFAGGFQYDQDYVPTNSVISHDQPLEKNGWSGGWYNKETGKYEGGWVRVQQNMVIKGWACDTPEWKGKCKSSTLTFGCILGSKKKCEPVMAKYLQDHPLQPNQKVFYNWIQTCVNDGDPEPVETPKAENGKTDYEISVTPAEAGEYAREGGKLGLSSDDFAGKYGTKP